MFAITEAAQWAQENFGRCDLGDKRRSARLVRIAGDLARNTGASLLKSCDGDSAAAEGLYRLLRNAEVDPDAIAEGGFEATTQRARSCELLLAVEDSTSLAYRHSVAEELGTTSSNPTSVNKGFIVHSVVLLDGCTGATVGLIKQRRWTRVADDYGKSSDRKRRAYEDKESFKWQQAGQAVRARLGEVLSQRAIAVCDREAHISEYLLWQQTVGGRYVVRAAGDRRLCDTQYGLWDTLAQAPWLGSHEIQIPQRGGRPARSAQLSVRANSMVAEWAYRAIARLGGWMNTQRTGRPGWQAIWYGLFRLAERVETHRLAVELSERSDQ